MGKLKLSNPAWIALCTISLAGCAPLTTASETNEPSSAAPSSMEKPSASGSATSPEAGTSQVPFAQGEADVEGLTSAQIEVMFAEALKLVKPFAEHQAVCLAMATDTSGRQGDPPKAVIVSFQKLTDLPVVPASRCAFDVSPAVIESGERAMLYTVVVEHRHAKRTIKFWAHAIYGNLGANGAEFILRRGPTGWSAIPTGVSSIS